MKRAAHTMLTLASMLCMALLVGCQTAPGRTQTQTFEKCTFNVMLPAGANPSNVCAAADGGTMGDLFTQNMLVDTSGSEVNSPTSTPTVTTPIEANVNSAGGSGMASKVADAALSKLGVGAADTTKAASADVVKAAATPEGACPDGSCSEGNTTAK